MADLRAKAEENKDSLAALMITYPSTHGIFETGKSWKSARLSMPAARRCIWTAPT